MNSRFFFLKIFFAGFLLAVSSFAQGPGQERAGGNNKGIRISDYPPVGWAVTRKIAPEYPPIAKAARASGLVTIEVEIDEKGKVLTAQVVSGHPLLREAALTAARQWEFDPVKFSVRSSNFTGVISFNFSLAGADSSLPVKRDPKADPVEALCDKGRELGSQGRYDEAVGQFNKALMIKPDSAWVHYNLGQTLVSARRYAEAEASCSEALKIRSEELRREGGGERDLIYENATVCLGMADFHQGRYDEAISKFRKIAGLEKEMFDVRFFLGAALYRKGDYDAAIAALRESLGLKPENETAYLMLGDVYSAHNQLKDAIAAYQQCLKFALGPEELYAHYGLGVVYFRSGDRPAALKEYEALKVINPQMAARLLVEINK